MPGRIEGVVWNDAGALDAGREIGVTMKGGTADIGRVKSDERGRFVVENLLAGDYTLSTEPGPADFERMDHPLVGWNWEPRSTVVTVSPGKPVQAVLGSDMRDGVHVRGRVTSGGEPFTEFLVRAEYVADWWGVGLRSVLGKSDGTYELFLPRPGRWKVAVNLPGVTRKTEWVDVGSKRDATLDFEFSRATAAGRIVDSDGNGLASLHVWLAPDPRVHPVGAGVIQFGAETDAEGNYRIDHVDPGTHILIVQGRGRGPMGSLDLSRVAHGIEVSPDVETRIPTRVLRQPGSIRARFRAPEGRVLQWVKVTCTDESGFPDFGTGVAEPSRAYELVNVLPQRAWLHASGEGLALATPHAVDVASGKTTEVELNLVPAYPIHVSVESNEDHRASVRLSIVDSNAAVRTWTCGLERVGGGSEFTIEGLPNGKYAITATDGQGRTATTNIEVLDQAPELVRMQLEP